MKSKRILFFTMVVTIIVVVAGAFLLWMSDSKEKSRQDDLNSQITAAQAQIGRAANQKAEKEAEAAALAAQLTEAKALLAQTGFRSSAESIEYDRLLFQIASDNHLEVNSITATAPLDLKEGDITYQQAAFNISLEGLTPTVIFASPQDSTRYIDGVVNDVLAFVNTLATSADFDTTQIQSVNINSPEPMTEEEIASMVESINKQVESQLTDEEKEGQTEEQIAALVQAKLAVMTPPEISSMMEIAGLEKPSATITIKIWIFKGASRG
jgi:type II secretory pathway pseudopilin PulG